MKKSAAVLLTILVMLVSIGALVQISPDNMKIRLKLPESFIKKEKTIKNPEDIMVLVNRRYKLSEDYKPKNMVIPKVNFSNNITAEEKQMRKETADAIEELFNAAKKNSMELYVVSAYRSYETQKGLYEERVSQRGKKEADKYVAEPGSSEHQTGLAVDVTNKLGSKGQLQQDFGQTKEGKWLKSNCHKYGFIIRYPYGKEKITGYNYEPWHIRYVGKKTAEEIFEKDIVLEEMKK